MAKSRTRRVKAEVLPDQGRSYPLALDGDPGAPSRGTGGLVANVGSSGLPVGNWETFNPGGSAFFVRQQFLDLMMDPRHNIDEECGYPSEITPVMYHLLYRRLGIARRVVNFMPEESWSLKPVVWEVEDEQKETPFEADWTRLLRQRNAWSWLGRVDRLSGIGRFGVLLLGLDDGRPYSEPAGELDARGMLASKRPHKLLFLRAFDETAVQVLQREVNPQNPRYGQPTRYLVTFRELDITEPAMLGTTAGGMVTSQVHWTRVIHVADQCDASQIYGVPRMQPVWNHLQDLRKLLGGSAEMFWKGAFPGISFEMNPGVADVDLDLDALREEMTRYENRLQRYIAAVGLTAKSLNPQVADPKGHVEAMLDQITIALGVPKRVFYGSEQAHLASTQDAKTWNARVARRQEDYLEPELVRRFIDRLIDLRVVRPPKEGKDGYNVYWPDLNTSTDAEKADLILKKVQALQAYLMGQVDGLVPPDQFLHMVFDMEPEQVRDIAKARRVYLGLKAEAAETGVDPLGRQVEQGQDQGGGEGPSGRPQEADTPNMRGGSGGSQVPETARSTKLKGVSEKRAEAQAISPVEES